MRARGHGSFVRDSAAFTRGAGAIASIDGHRSISRAELLRRRQIDAVRRDRAAGRMTTARGRLGGLGRIDTEVDGSGNTGAPGPGRPPPIRPGPGRGAAVVALPPVVNIPRGTRGVPGGGMIIPPTRPIVMPPTRPMPRPPTRPTVIVAAPPIAAPPPPTLDYGAGGGGAGMPPVVPIPPLAPPTEDEFASIEPLETVTAAPPAAKSRTLLLVGVGVGLLLLLRRS